MTSRSELVEKALRRQPTERLVCFPLVDLAYAASLAGQPVSRLALDPAAHAAALKKCLDDLPIDGVYINLCFASGQADIPGKDVDGYTLLLDDALEVRLPDNDVPSISRSRIDRMDDPRLETAELFHPGMLATFCEIQRQGPPDAAIVVGLTGAFSQVAFLYGLEKLMMEMLDHPREVQQAIEKRQNIVLQQAQELCQAGVKFIWIGEGVASGSLISPALYRQFVLPYEQQLAIKIRELGGLTILHICGNTTTLLPDIAHSGVDGYDLDWPVDLKVALDALSENMAVKGNINPTLFCSDSLTELNEQCRHARDSAANTPGYIMSTGCLVPRDSRREAFSVMAEICNQSPMFRNEQ